MSGLPKGALCSALDAEPCSQITVDARAPEHNEGYNL